MLKVTVPWCVKPEDAGLFISIIAISTRLNRLNRAWLGGCLTGLIQASIDRWNGAFIHWIGQVSRPLILLPGNADNGNGLCWVTKLDDSNSNPLLAAGFGIRRNTRRSRSRPTNSPYHVSSQPYPPLQPTRRVDVWHHCSGSFRAGWLNGVVRPRKKG